MPTQQEIEYEFGSNVGNKLTKREIFKLVVLHGILCSDLSYEMDENFGGTVDNIVSCVFGNSVSNE